MIFQVFSPAKVIFAGIGVLLSVSIRLDSSVRDTVMYELVRRLRMLTRVKMCLLISSHESRSFSNV